MSAAPTPLEMHQLYVHALGRIAGLGPGGASERVGPWLCIDAGMGVSRFNIAVVVDEVARPRAALRQAMEWFALRGINARLDLRGSEDGALLAASMVEGFQFWWREPAMVMHPIPDSFYTPYELEVRLAQTEDDLELYCQVDSEEYADQDFQRAMVGKAASMEQVSVLLGLVEGRPVARSMAVTKGSLVGIHNVYVPPSQRNRGYGAAMTAAAIDAGRASGANAACLEATALGFPVYAAMGFKRYDDYVTVGTEGPPI